MIRNIALTASVMCAAVGMNAAAHMPAFAQAQAEELGAPDAAEREFGQRFTSLSGQFGLPVYVDAVKTKRGSMLYTYIAPEGTAAEDALRATVTVFSVAEPEEFLEKYINSIQSEGVVRRELGKMKLYGQGDTFMSYTEYNIGRGSTFNQGGPDKKYYVSMVWQVLPGVVANFQIEKYNEPFTTETKDLFKEIVKQTAETQADRLAAEIEKQG